MDCMSINVVQFSSTKRSVINVRAASPAARLACCFSPKWGVGPAICSCLKRILSGSERGITGRRLVFMVLPVGGKVGPYDRASGRLN